MGRGTPPGKRSPAPEGAASAAPAKTAAAVIVAAAAASAAESAFEGRGTPCFRASALAIARPRSASSASAAVAGSAVASSQPRTARRTLQSAWSAAPAEARLAAAAAAEEEEGLLEEAGGAAAPATIGSIASCSIACFFSLFRERRKERVRERKKRVTFFSSWSFVAVDLKTPKKKTQKLKKTQNKKLTANGVSSSAAGNGPPPVAGPQGGKSGWCARICRR